MITIRNCQIVSDTAKMLDCIEIDVFYYALSVEGRPFNSETVMALNESWQKGETLPQFVEDFCLDVLTCRVAILAQKIAVKARKRGE